MGMEYLVPSGPMAMMVLSSFLFVLLLLFDLRA